MLDETGLIGLRSGLSAPANCSDSVWSGERRPRPDPGLL